MSVENIGKGSNENLINIYQSMERGDLILNPEFQRRLVWNADHKEYFLDTILKGYPFPEVYFADGPIDPVSITCKTLVVDGQQRLSTIYQYIKGTINIRYKIIKKYSELTETERDNFLYSTIVVRRLGRLSDDQIKEIFKRINSVSYALNSMEINNALYNGDYISTAKKIASDMAGRNFDYFKKGDYDRMKDLEYVLTIMTSVELGVYFSNNKEVESYVKKYDDSYENADKIISDFKDVTSIIDKIEIGWRSVFNSKSAMFTLLCELLKAKYKGIALPNCERIQNVINDVDIRIANPEDESNDEYLTFYYYVCQGTGSKVGRTMRGEFIYKLLFE